MTATADRRTGHYDDGVRRLHAEGLHNNAIARELGTSPSSVQAVMRRLGLTKNDPPPPDWGDRACRVDGCGNKAGARGVCQRHKGHPAQLPPKPKGPRRKGTYGQVTDWELERRARERVTVRCRCGWSIDTTGANLANAYAGHRRKCQA